MSVLKNTFAMLEPGGAGRGAASTRSVNAGALVVAAIGVMAGATATHASELKGVFINTEDDFYDSFNVESTAGVADASPDYIDFAITNDIHGYNAIEFGDTSTGFYDEDLSYVGDGFVGVGYLSGGVFTAEKYDSITPAVYNGNPTGFVLQPGTYTGDFAGSFFALEVPEPEAWALLVAGAALTGGALRAGRRRRQASAVAANG